VGPSFAAAEVVDVVEAILDVYRDKRETHETFARTLNRVGFDVFKAAANAARNTTARAE
jgi:sulfite reductase (NADPH) hemoprotein beta-component